DRAAVEGLISRLEPAATLVPKGAIEAPESGPGISRTNLFDSGIAYFRISRLTDSSPNDLQKVFQDLAGANQIRGVILDLRYAAGDDYGAATHVAGMFLTNQIPLAD